MAKRPEMKLDDLVAKKHATAAPTQLDSTASGVRRGQTLRLEPEMWKQLKKLAVDEETTSHALLLEAVDMLFRSRGLPPGR